MLHSEIINRGCDREWILLLHGMGGSSATWARQIDEFASRMNVLAVDFYGHGLTRQTLPGYSFQGLSDAIVRVMDREGIESAHVAGISLGTIVAAMMGLRAEGRVSSLILGGATPGVDLRAKVLLHCGRLLKGVMPYMWLYSFFAWIMMPKSNHARSRQVFVREAHKLGSGEFRKWYRLIQAYPGMCRGLMADLQQVPISKLFISGSQDHLFLKSVRAYVRKDPMARLHVLERCGHVCNIEREREFNRLCLSFVQGEKAADLAAAAMSGAQPATNSRPALVTQWASR